MFTLNCRHGCGDKYFELSEFAALGEFFVRDYIGLQMRQGVWEGHIEGLEQGLDIVRRSWDSQTVAGAFYLQFHGAECL